MGYARSLIVGLMASQTIAVAAIAGGRTNASETSAVVHRQRENSSENTTKDNRASVVTPLDRVATAVDSAESSHGTDIGMWRADPSGPQGPMQVSEAAAMDVGGAIGSIWRRIAQLDELIWRSYINVTVIGRMRLPPIIGAAVTWTHGSGRDGHLKSSSSA